METYVKYNKSATAPQIYDWDSINWKKIYKYVKKLRQRIFHAEQLGQARKVRKLQRLMIRSKANLLLSIKRVTQINKGKRTAGIDKMIITSNKDRIKLFNLIKDYNVKSVKVKPAKRKYIPKKNGKLRPLGIPIIKDRIYQNIIRNALEPQWESKFESISYGFRPKRSAQDAIQQLFLKLRKGSKRQWIFEGDFKGCFDNLNHDYITTCIKEFPCKEIILKWLKAGYIDDDVFNETLSGTPQGGIISPLLANIALHGMEKELGVVYKHNKQGYLLDSNSVGIVRYADDFVILCKTKNKAESMYEKLKPYLKKRGLTLAEDKTKITHISDGFDFLGFNVKQYKTVRGVTLLIKPSKSSVKKVKQHIKEIFKRYRGNKVGVIINQLNPIIRGTGNYWSSSVSKDTYKTIDYYIWIKVRKYLKSMHPNKPWKWIIKKYFTKDIHGVSTARWLLTDKSMRNCQLAKMQWIPIVRHQLIKYKNSPDDATLKEYFMKRDEKEFKKNNILSKQKLAKKCKHICRICNQSLFEEGETLEINQIVPKVLGGKDVYRNFEILHKSCCKQHKKLLKKYGKDRQLSNIKKFFNEKQIEPSSKEGIKLMKEQFRHFEYNC
ncbi:group II intron reverse transcriptase/maturase [Clostridium cagae]|uniref:group II intron reverse transcriptase/maturase n=1 Tax=Clostridium TaxID=1485 RepID=UPI0013FEEAB7|nr:group II intron reverse transcriptase/maturase [Clostridium botulinum]MBY6836806.1 group II intron reverse transcriptase/maturase [Clostridium botulinum]NFG66393.1 group II intron reverse transcriptase/maturase [Clostridium botulinum]NFQ25602.1 group II intron reverse transcriptase/maturase [Clostridium botulinum]